MYEKLWSVLCCICVRFIRIKSQTKWIIFFSLNTILLIGLYIAFFIDVSDKAWYSRPNSPGNFLPKMTVPPIYENDLAHIIETLNLTEHAGCPKVPKIIHQTWKTEKIPIKLSEYMKSWKEHNPKWKYWFWSDELGNLFMKRRFPRYYKMFQKYKKGIQRADALRYFIMYEFGGIYADIDMMALKSWDFLAKKHTALIPSDHPIHMMQQLRERTPLQALIMSTPGHKVMRKVIENLPKYNDGTDAKEVLWKTGPYMVNEIIGEYERNVAEEEEGVSVCNAMYLPSSDTFVPNYVNDNLPYLKMICDKSMQDPKVKEMCQEQILIKDPNNKVPNNVYSNHMFVHTEFVHLDSWKKVVAKSLVHIDDVMPRRTNVATEILKLDGPNNSV